VAAEAEQVERTRRKTWSRIESCFCALHANGIFRVVDCKLMYTLATSSLPGVGTYTVYAVINGTPASNPAVFDLR
jgi:hypothetical protein